VLLPTVFAVSVFFAAIAGFAVKAQMRKPQTGKEAMVGMEGDALSDIVPEGKVFVYGETWNAISDDKILKGEKVKVTGVDNLKLKVQKIGAR
jgi:membrane-bound serine protease (ClpP class)